MRSSMRVLAPGEVRKVRGHHSLAGAGDRAPRLCQDERRLLGLGAVGLGEGGRLAARCRSSGKFADSGVRVEAPNPTTGGGSTVPVCAKHDAAVVVHPVVAAPTLAATPAPLLPLHFDVCVQLFLVER